MPLTVFRGPYSALIQSGTRVTPLMFPSVWSTQLILDKAVRRLSVMSPAEAACCSWWPDPLGPASVLGQGSTFPGCPELASPLVQDLEMSLAVPP